MHNGHILSQAEAIAIRPSSRTRSTHKSRRRRIHDTED